MVVVPVSAQGQRWSVKTGCGAVQWRPAVKTDADAVKSGVVAALRFRCRGGAAGSFPSLAAPL